MRTVSVVLVALLTLLALPLPSSAFLTVLDGVKSFSKGDDLFIVANSFRTRRGLVPLNYYSLPLCKPSKEDMKLIKRKQNLGETLQGNRLLPTQYKLKVGEDVAFQPLCETTFTDAHVTRANNMVDRHYRGFLNLEGNPAMESVANRTRVGFSVGASLNLGSISQNAFHNHLDFTVYYRDALPPLFFPGDRAGTRQFEIVGLQVTPRSLSTVDAKKCAESKQLMEQTNPFLLPRSSSKSSVRVPLSYGVTWVLATDANQYAEWNIQRRQELARRRQTRGHWMTAMNASALVLLLGVLVGAVLARTVRKDLMVYAEEENLEELRDEKGWKLLRGDVFRPPSHSLLLSAFIGSGSQLALVFGSLLVASFLGVVTPSQRGALLTFLVVFFFLSSSFAGYVTARMLKYFKKQSWKSGITAVMLVPTTLFIGYMTLNCIHWAKHSTFAIPFTTFLFLLFVWLLCATPLALIGVVGGFQQDVVSIPLKVNLIPRLIPMENARKGDWFALIGGLIPFSAFFIEFLFVLAAMWREDAVYRVGSTAAVSGIIAILSAEVSVIVTYLTLCQEDYRWWWRSFWAVASTGVYLFLYSLFYLVAYLQIRMFSSVILYIAYMLAACSIVALMLGTVGFLSAAFFVRSIYSAIKAD